MSSSPSLSLALPTKAAKSVTPPLRRGELIEAMAQRKFAQLQQQQRENTVRRDKLTEKINAAAKKVCITGQSDGQSSVTVNWSYDRGNGKRLATSFNICNNVTLTPSDPAAKEIAALVEEREAIPLIYPELKYVRRDIRNQISGATGDRVGSILKDKASVRAIDEMLAKLENKPAIAIEG